VIIMLGTNDSKPGVWGGYSGQFLGDYKAMVNTFKNLSSAPEVFVNTSPSVKGTAYGVTDAVVSGQVVPLQRQAAAETGCPVIDINTLTTPWNAGYYVDGLHPTDAGLQLIAQKIHDEIVP
jgi:acyl-CoA thioesterase I